MTCVPLLSASDDATGCAGAINTTGDCTGQGGCPAGDTCVYDYNAYESDACCEHAALQMKHQHHVRRACHPSQTALMS